MNTNTHNDVHTNTHNDVNCFDISPSLYISETMSIVFIFIVILSFQIYTMNTNTHNDVHIST